MDENLLLGKIVKLHSVDGKVTVSTIRALPDTLPEITVVFLETEGKQVPFFVESYEARGENTLLLTFEGYKGSEQLNCFRGCRVYLSSSLMKKEEEAFDFRELEGYHIVSESRKISGSVTEINEIQGTVLLKIITDTGSSILVPFHPDLVISLNRKKKVIYMNLPEGLENLND